MKPSANQKDGDLLVRSNWVAGVAVSESAVAITHILGRRRLVCCNFIAELLFHDFQGPATIAQVAQRRNAPVELIRRAAETLYAALLIRKVETDELAAIRLGLDVRFGEPAARDPAWRDIDRYPPRLFRERRRGSAGSNSTDDDTQPADAAVGLDTPLQLSSALTAMRFGDDTGGVVTHFLEGPLLLERDLWSLAMAFRNQVTLREAIASGGLPGRGADELIAGCRFLARRRVLCTSPDRDIAAIRERIAPEIELVTRRFATARDVTPAGHQDPHFMWYQPYGYHAIDSIEPLRARGRVAFLGQCQSHFLAGALEFLAQRAGWHLETHGWFDATDELAARDWSLIVLPTVAEAAAFYEACAVGDVDACRKLAPEILARVNRNICAIREKTDAPILAISVAEATLHGHGHASKTRHGIRHVIARLNNDLIASLAAFEDVSLLDEASVLSRYPDTITLDDEYNATPHHCGFDLWSWRDHPFEAGDPALPEKAADQMHPAFPLARACVEHLRLLYASPRIDLIVFEPNGLLWPGVIDRTTRPYPKGINVYTGLGDFAHVGIHEALCLARSRGIKLACLSSSETELLRHAFDYESAARNLVRWADLVCALGGDDKRALLDRILDETGVEEEAVLWIDAANTPIAGFKGRAYTDSIAKLRRYLLTETLLDPFSTPHHERRRPAAPHAGDAEAPPDRDAVASAVDSVLIEHLRCPASALRETDDLRLLGLDSFGGAALVVALEGRLRFRLPDHDYVGSVMFSRQGLQAAIGRALEPASAGAAATVTSPGRWFDAFTREDWCEQNVATLLSHHFRNPGVAWILKFIRSAEPFDYRYATWRELHGRSLGYTRLYRNAGLNPGDTITILLPQGPNLIGAIVGAILGGMVPSISAFPGDKLSSDLFLEWFGEIARRSRTRCIVCPDELEAVIAGELAAQAMPIITSVPEPAWDEPLYSGSPDSAVLLQHSSGTTGLKKGVKLSNRAVLAQVWDLSQALECNDDDVIVSWLPYYHDMGLIACLLLPLLRSIPTVVMSPFDWVRQPHMLLRQISEERGTLCWLPNFAFAHCARQIRADQLEGVDLASLRAVIDCSEPVTHGALAAFCERFERCGIRLSALSASYAMAETTFAVTQTRPGKPPGTVDASSLAFAREGRIVQAPERGSGAIARFVSSGRVLPGARVRIVDNGTVLAEGQVGEIQVRGDYVFSGYDNDEEKRDDVFDDGWYLTGDLGFLLDGELYVTGRKKDLIIVAGHNVYPHDVENDIGSLPHIKPGRVAAFGVFDDDEGTEKLVLMAELDAASISGATDLDEATVKATIRDHLLSKFFVNASDIRLFRTETLRKSTSGKIARSANRELYRSLSTQDV